MTAGMLGVRRRHRRGGKIGDRHTRLLRRRTPRHAALGAYVRSRPLRERSRTSEGHHLPDGRYLDDFRRLLLRSKVHSDLRQLPTRPRMDGRRDLRHQLPPLGTARRRRRQPPLRRCVLFRRVLAVGRHHHAHPRHGSHGCHPSVQANPGHRHRRIRACPRWWTLSAAVP